MGLRNGDLRDLVYDIFEVDSYKSKMGEDKDIITLSFSVKDKAPAEDLMDFLEKGYEYVLDADVTPGEQVDGTYKVFVEIERNRESINQIMEIADGVRKLAKLGNLKFRYYKNFRSEDLSEESLSNVVPTDPDAYGGVVTEASFESYKNFFSRSYVDNIEMLEDDLYIKKPYADKLVFEFVDFGEHADVQRRLDEKIDVNSFAEVIFLTKYVGDYNITKYGDKLVFENNNRALVLKRVIL